MTQLGNRTLCRKVIDMEYVYSQIAKGRTIQSIADELHVSRSTIYRRHAAYQKDNNETFTNNDLMNTNQESEYNPFI